MSASRGAEGSLARGPRGGPPPWRRGLAHLPLFRIGVGVDLLVYTPEEYDRLRADGHPLIERAEREGITVYARPESGGTEVARTG